MAARPLDLMGSTKVKGFYPSSSAGRRRTDEIDWADPDNRTPGRSWFRVPAGDVDG